MTLNVPLFYYPNIFPNAHYHKALHRKDKEYRLVCGRVEKPCVQTNPISPPLFSETVWTVMQKTIIFPHKIKKPPDILCCTSFWSTACLSGGLYYNITFLRQMS